MYTPGEKETKKEADAKLYNKKRNNNDTLFNNKNPINRLKNKKGANENTKEKKETDNRNKEDIKSAGVGDEGSDDVFCSIGGPCPEFGMPLPFYFETISGGGIGQNSS